MKTIKTYTPLSEADKVTYEVLLKDVVELNERIKHIEAISYNDRVALIEMKNYVMFLKNRTLWQRIRNVT